MRQLFTAADIRRLAREQKSDVLILGHTDLITPEAVDLARELRVRLIRESAPPPRLTLHALRLFRPSKWCAARV